MSSLGLTNQFNLLRVSRVCCLQPSSTVASVRFFSASARNFTKESVTSTLLRQTAVQRTFAVPRRTFSHTPTFQFSPSSIMGAPSEFVISITSKAEFNEKVLGENTGPVVVDCFATWCGPCKAIAPKVEQFAKEYPTAKFYQIDVDELSEVAAELGVRAMPTFMLFKDGQKVTEVVGANPPALEAGVKSLIA